MNIELTQEQAEAFGRGESITLTPKPKQWEPRVDLDWVDISTYTRLLQYVKEFDYFWEADWKNIHQEKGYVYYNYSSHRWSAESWVSRCCGGTVYMSEECAKDLAAKLNSGEVVL
mgnify:CR=1 FL=1